MNHCDLGPKRCPTCKQQRYGYQHQLRRKQWTPVVMAGQATCSRCHQPIAPGVAWDLDHIGGDTWPAHTACNRRHTTVRGNASSRRW